MKMREWVKENFSKDDLAFITGSTTGIGYEYARAFASFGCNLLCLSNEDAALQKVKEELETEFKVSVTNILLDLRDTRATKLEAEKLADRPIKILVNNAGMGLKGLFESNVVDKYIDVIAVNVTAPVIFNRAILPRLQKNGKGVVIHVASINALVPIPNSPVYSATKAFCLSYSLAVARENKNSPGIKFQLVLPGTTKTPFHDRQGSKATKMVMLPEEVVAASLKNIDCQVNIPNPADRLTAKIMPLLPRNMAMDIAGYMLKKRL